MPKPRKDYRALPNEIQRRRVDQLERFVKFAAGGGEETLESLGRLCADILGTSLTRGAFTKAEFENLREWLRHGLSRVAAGLDWIVNSAELSPYELVVTVNRPHIEASPGALARHAFLRVIGGEEWRIARCTWPLCEGGGAGRLFMKRKKGLYCRPQHAQAMHSLRHFDPERAEQLERQRDAKRAQEKRMLAD